MQAHFQIFCDDLVDSGRNIWLTATGVSMWPLITEGMKAEIAPVGSALPKKGDLLLIKRNNGLVVHRYWGTTYREGVPLVLTKGDTNIAFDPPIPLTMVRGQLLLLKNSAGACRNLTRGWLCILGRILVSSYPLAYVWARLCRLILKLRK